MPECKDDVDDIEDLVSVNDIDGAKRPNRRNSTVIFRNQFKVGNFGSKMAVIKDKFYSLRNTCFRNVIDWNAP